MPCNAISDERGKPRVMSCATRNVAVYAANTGSEKQARQGERGFDRRERTQKYVTKAKRKFNTVLRCLYEAERSLHVVFYTTSHLILSLVNTQISLAILSALVAISSAE